MLNVRCFFGAICLAAFMPCFLSGCSGASSSTPAAATPSALGTRIAQSGHRSTFLLPSSRPRHARGAALRSWIKPVPRSAPLLYVSDPYLNVVNIYDENGSGQTPIGQIAGFDEPQSMWVTSTQKLWVANTNAMNLEEFKRGSVVPIRTVSDPNGFPAGVCGNNNK